MLLAHLILAGSVAMAAAPAVDLETRAETLEGRLMSPCCMTNTVAVHESGASYKIRSEIREMLAAGKTDREILDHFVAEHGPQILSIPDARGFNLTAYLFPIGFLMAGAAVLWIAMRRWRGSPRAATTTSPPPPDSKYAARLDRELRLLD
jgi:cytochrome c-type biogenesis protein CcmH